MSNRAPKMDLGSMIALLISLVMILVVVYFLITSLINTYNKNSTKGVIDNSAYVVGSAADNLKPIGSSATSEVVEKASTPVAARSGKEVYTAVCGVCHETGVAGAPITTDKAAWEPRVATGLDALMATAVKGKGAMPPRAGQNIGDTELKAAIIYMTTQAGFSLGGDTTEAVKKAEPAPVVATPKAEEKVAEKKETPKSAPEAPKKPEAPAMKTVEKVAEKAPEVAATPAGLDGKALYTGKGCGACHGMDAKTPIMPLYPKVAGQGEVYVTQQLKDIKSGKRSNGQSIVMKGIMAGVSEEEITAIAKYVSSLK